MAFVTDLIEGDMLFVVCQLKRDVIVIVIALAAKTSMEMIAALRFVYYKWKDLRPVGWGGGKGWRGSNEPPKILKVGIFGELKR